MGEEAATASEDGGEETSLSKFCVDLNAKARDGKVDPLIGRGDEVERCIQVLCRRRKNNPLLVGDPGVGKTAIAEGLAKKIVDGETPEILSESTIFSLDMGALLAGTRYRAATSRSVSRPLSRNWKSIRMRSSSSTRSTR